MTLNPSQREDVDAARQHRSSTLRPVVPALEEILFDALPVLDHGFVRVIDYMGDDAAVVQAARVSYGRGTKRVNEDRNLIKDLMRHWHTTPFEMAEIKLHIKLPIFIARQWIRHRTASVNEYSARYSVLDKEFYLPAPDQLAAQSTSNRQGRDAPIGGQEADAIMALLRADAEQTYANYQWMLNEDAEGRPVDAGRPGVARELARMNLTLNTYTQWYWKVNLHNFMNFLRLRADAHAQFEIRAYAAELQGILKRWVPMTHDAFVEYRQDAVNLSKTAAAVVRRLLAGETVTAETSGLSAREWREFSEALELDRPPAGGR